MKYSFISVLLLSAILSTSPGCKAQKEITNSSDINTVINVKEVERIERVLAADDMRGSCPRLKQATKAEAGDCERCHSCLGECGAAPLPYPFTSEFPATHLRAR